MVLQSMYGSKGFSYIFLIFPRKDGMSKPVSGKNKKIPNFAVEWSKVI